MGEVVVAELIDPLGLQILQSHGAVLYDPALFRDRPRLFGALASARGLVVRNQTAVGPELLAAAPRLRVVGRLGAGLDNIDRPALEDRGIHLVYAPDAATASVAEFTVALILALFKDLGRAHRPTCRGGWDRSGYRGLEVGGRTVGIIGLGRIGRAVANRAAALGMKITAHHPRLGAGERDISGTDVGGTRVALAPMDEVLSGCDVLTLHLPLGPATRGLIGRRELRLMRPGSYLVNTSRGAVLDEEALYDALSAGHLAGAALDVRAVEPPGAQPPFGELPNVILTPHVAALTREAQERVAREVAAGVVEYLQAAGVESCREIMS